MAKLPVLPTPEDVRTAGAALDAAKDAALADWDEMLTGAENALIMDEKLKPYRDAHSAAMAKYDSNWHPL